MDTYELLADLPVTIDSLTLSQQSLDTSSGFTRMTTVVSLEGDGEIGRGEDVTYDSDHHEALNGANPFDITGSYTIDSFSDYVGEIELFPDGEPGQSIFHQYRQWGFESAALDLALKQADTSLGEQLDRQYQPVNFIVSTRLGDPPTADRLHKLRAIHSNLEFKLDPTSDWTTELIHELTEIGGIRVLDLKGLYSGTEVDQGADPVLYEQILEAFPDSLVEDPAIDDATRPLLEQHADRVTWDYPITGIPSIRDLPWEPEWLNIKPSRFGSICSLCDTLDYCRAHEIELFGGGQFELSIGRHHLHTIASLFYPDSPNDVAPRSYHSLEVARDAPSPPLQQPTDPTGLEWS